MRPRFPAHLSAVGLALTAAAAFSGAAALAKTATQVYPVLQILLIRQFFVLATCAPSLARGGTQALRTRRPVLHCTRLAGAFVALASDIWAVSVLPLATATTLGFTKILLAVSIAQLVFREGQSKRTGLSVGLGLLGVCLLVQPGFGTGALWAYGIPLLGAVGAAIAMVSVRALAHTETSATLLVYQATCVGLMAAVPMAWLWVPPDAHGVLVLAGIGALAALGQWAGIAALRHGAVRLVGPIEYSRAVFAVALGWLMFGETVDGVMVAGAGVIVVGCVLAAVPRKA